MDESSQDSLLPYGRQWIDDEDIEAVVNVLRSAWLTTGPAVDRFETSFAETVHAAHAVAVSSGTAALHAAVAALGIGEGDEVIVAAMTFAASANAVVFTGGTPKFADVSPQTLLIDPGAVEPLITPRTRAVIAVDYAGQPCDYSALQAVADANGIAVIADAAHSLGASVGGRLVGSLGDLTTFSFHPVKHITTGEGGMVTTDDPGLNRRLRRFRNHGIASDHRQRSEEGTFFYEMVDLGFNYRITDIQAALGLSQLRKLERFVQRRREIAAAYDSAFASIKGIRTVASRPGAESSHHLYPILLEPGVLGKPRDRLFRELRDNGIGVNVHYLPVHLHPYYREQFGTAVGDCPVAEEAYKRLLSLPLYPAMTDEDVLLVVQTVRKVLEYE